MDEESVDAECEAVPDKLGPDAVAIISVRLLETGTSFINIGLAISTPRSYNSSLNRVFSLELHGDDIRWPATADGPVVKEGEVVPGALDMPILDWNGFSKEMWDEFVKRHLQHIDNILTSESVEDRCDSVFETDPFIKEHIGGVEKIRKRYAEERWQLLSRAAVYVTLYHWCEHALKNGYRPVLVSSDPVGTFGRLESFFTGSPTFGKERVRDFRAVDGIAHFGETQRADDPPFSLFWLPVDRDLDDNIVVARARVIDTTALEWAVVGGNQHWFESGISIEGVTPTAQARQECDLYWRLLKETLKKK